MRSRTAIVASPDRKWRETVSRGLDGLQDRVEATTLEPSGILEADADSDGPSLAGKAHFLVLDVRCAADAQKLAETKRELPRSTIFAVVDEQEAGATVSKLYWSGANVCLPRGGTLTETVETVRAAVSFYLDYATLPDAL